MQLVKLSQVKGNPKNPRVIRDHKFNKLVKSITEFPDMLNKRPLIVFTDKDDKYVVLGGNMRLKALKELKYKEVPVIVADEWTEEQKAQFLIKDNVGFGEWDWDLLGNEWDVDNLNDWGLEIPYWLVEDMNEAEDIESNQTIGKHTDDFAMGYLESDIKKFEVFVSKEEYSLFMDKLNKLKNDFNAENNSNAIVQLILSYGN